MRKIENAALGGFIILLILGLSGCNPAAQDGIAHPDEDLITGTWRARDTVHDEFSGDYILITANTIRPDSTYELSNNIKINEEINPLYSERGDWRTQDNTLIYMPSQSGCFHSHLTVEFAPRS